MRTDVVPFSRELEDSVALLILEIQQREFGIPIRAEDQPDLRQIPGFYQVGNGNFWVARSGARVVGTIALLDLGSAQCALRKMFVHRDFRGELSGTARRLLDTLLDWCETRALREIYLGTTEHFHAAHRFYAKHGFDEIARSELPRAFPIMQVDTKFFRRRLAADVRGEA